MTTSISSSFSGQRPRTTSSPDARVRLVGSLWATRATGLLSVSTGTAHKLIPVIRGGLMHAEDGPTLVTAILSGRVGFEPSPVRGAGDVLAMGAAVLDAARAVVRAPSPAAVWEPAPSIERVRLDGIGLAEGAIALLDGVDADLIQLVVGADGWRQALLDLTAMELIGGVRAVFGLWEEGIPYEDTAEAEVEVTEPVALFPGATEDNSEELLIADARADIRAGRYERAAQRLRAERDQRIDSALVVAWLALAEVLRGNRGINADFRPRHWARFARTLDPLDAEVRLLSARVESLCDAQAQALQDAPMAPILQFYRAS